MKPVEEVNDLCDLASQRLADTEAMMDRNEYDQAEQITRKVIEDLDPLVPDQHANLDHEEPWRSVISIVANAYNRLNTVHSTHGDLVNAISTAQRGIELTERTDGSVRMVGLLHNLGVAYYNMGDAARAVE